MKKGIKTVFLIVVIAVSFLLGNLNSQAQPQEDPQTKVSEVFEKALELNKGRFADPNFILVGDTVLFPTYEGPGIMAYIAEKPTDGRHDSFWRLSEKYVAGMLKTVPADTVRVKMVVPEVEESNPENKSGISLAGLVAIAIAIIFLVLLCIEFLSDYLSKRPGNPISLFLNHLSKRPENPNNFPPVAGNIDAQPREQTLTSVMMRYLLPGERLINFRRGTLSNNLGKRRFSVSMEFGDNVRRDVWMNSGERVSTAIIEDRNGNRRTQHLRNACSNGFGGGSFELPSGWFIQYDESEEAGSVITEDDGQGGQRLIVTPTTPAPIPTPEPTNFQSSLGALAQVITSLGIKNEGEINISFEETKKEVKLSIKIGKTKNKKDPKDKKSKGKTN